MRIIDLKIKDDTKNYKYFYVQYTNWWNPDDMKIRHGFVQKKTNDCFWDNTGDRLIARTERAVLAWVERVESRSLYVQKLGRPLRNNSGTKPKDEASQIRKIIHSRIENHQLP